MPVYAEYQNYLLFQWGEIPCGSRNTDISYSYETRDVNNQVVDGVTYSTTGTYLYVNDLQCDTTYRVYVVANEVHYSNYGEGTTCCSSRGKVK